MRSVITLHPSDSITILPNLPPRFRTFFTGKVAKREGTALAGKIVCLFGLWMPHASFAKIYRTKMTLDHFFTNLHIFFHTKSFYKLCCTKFQRNIGIY